MNRHDLTALVALSEDFYELADKLKIDVNTLESAITDYDSLSRRQQAEINNAVNAYVNIDLDGTNEQAELTDYVEKIEGASLFLERGLENTFNTLIGNNDIEFDDIETIGYIFANMNGKQQNQIMQAIAKNELNATILCTAYDNDGGNIYMDDSEFWDYARDYLDS